MTFDPTEQEAGAEETAGTEQEETNEAATSEEDGEQTEE